MSYIKPINHHPRLEKNKLGLTRRDYEGAISTLCAGCGHDSISACIIEACFQLNIEAYKVAKLSGIGCSSKAPAYFLNQSHGFNSVHGRMPSVATGANCANGDLLYLGISGDGDSASIGIGQFIHAIRRQINMVYFVENNGTYGLTKGQFSATNDLESKNKYGEDNLFKPIDLASMAIQLGASYVARSFSGDRDQLIPLIECVVRNFAAGSICKRLGLEEGMKMEPPIFEFFYKDDDLGDPLINDCHITAFGWAKENDIEIMKDLTLKTNSILVSLFDAADLILVDFKIEFGLSDGKIFLGDEFTPDGCRVWDKETKKKLDKDRFRLGLGDVVESYQEIAHRLGIDLT